MRRRPPWSRLDPGDVAAASAYVAGLLADSADAIVAVGVGDAVAAGGVGDVGGGFLLALQVAGMCAAHVVAAGLALLCSASRELRSRASRLALDDLDGELAEAAELTPTLR